LTYGIETRAVRIHRVREGKGKGEAYIRFSSAAARTTAAPAATLNLGVYLHFQKSKLNELNKAIEFILCS